MENLNIFLILIQICIKHEFELACANFIQLAQFRKKILKIREFFSNRSIKSITGSGTKPGTFGYIGIFGDMVTKLELFVKKMKNTRAFGMTSLIEKFYNFVSFIIGSNEVNYQNVPNYALLQTQSNKN
jgi:hypothetical protein